MRELKKGKKERRLYTSLSETNKVALLTMVVREKRRGGGARGKEERSMERIERKGRREEGRKEGGKWEGGKWLYTFPSATNKAALPTIVCHRHHSGVKHCNKQ